MSRNFIHDVLDRAEECHWKAIPKENGYLLMPPIGKVRPGYGSIYVYDPRNDSHKRDTLLSNLKKAGLIVYQEKVRVVTKTNGSNGAAHPAPTSAVPAPVTNPFTKLRARISDCMTALSEMESAISEIEAQGVEAEKIREFGRMLFGKS